MSSTSTTYANASSRKARSATKAREGNRYNRMLRKASMLFAANMAELMRMYADGKIRQRVPRTSPLEKAADAIKALGDRQALGKIVVTIND
nr:zinc-binding dehydrogenase [uncultured Brevundimonas sp.]